MRQRSLTALSSSQRSQKETIKIHEAVTNCDVEEVTSLLNDGAGMSATQKLKTASLLLLHIIWQIHGSVITREGMHYTMHASMIQKQK